MSATHRQAPRGGLEVPPTSQRSGAHRRAARSLAFTYFATIAESRTRGVPPPRTRSVDRKVPPAHRVLGRCEVGPDVTA
jgi:hypothetical protein